MSTLIFILIIIAILALLYFSQKWNTKRNLIASNSFLQSDATSKTIDSITSEEERQQEARLMQNKRYRILYEELMSEIKSIQSMSFDEAKTKFSQRQPEKVISRPEFNIVVKTSADLSNSSSVAIKVSTYPKRFLGNFFAVEKWVYIKKS